MKTNARVVDEDTGDTTFSEERKAKKLAHGHYENFNIAAFFIPKRLRQDLFNIYAFCRLADDISDKTSDEAEAEITLTRWEQCLESAAQNNAADSFFATLGNSIRRHNLSLVHFKNLLAAFRMDLTVKRWETWQDLREYTRHSADPVGRLTLELFGYENSDYFALSDKICTGLQLANHWQDVSDDWNRGRVYIPQEDLKRFGVSEEDIGAKHASDRFKKLMAFEVDRARILFEEGLPLLSNVNSRLAAQLALYWCGGKGALQAIVDLDYDVLNRSARLNSFQKFNVMLHAVVRWIMA